MCQFTAIIVATAAWFSLNLIAESTRHGDANPWPDVIEAKRAREVVTEVERQKEFEVKRQQHLQSQRVKMIEQVAQRIIDARINATFYNAFLAKHRAYSEKTVAMPDGTLEKRDRGVALNRAEQNFKAALGEMAHGGTGGRMAGFLASKSAGSCTDSFARANDFLAPLKLACEDLRTVITVFGESFNADDVRDIQVSCDFAQTTKFDVSTCP